MELTVVVVTICDRGSAVLYVGIQIGCSTIFCYLSCLSLGLNPNCFHTSDLFVPLPLTGSAVGEQIQPAPCGYQPLLKFNLLPDAAATAFLTPVAFCFIRVKLIG